jgi:ribosomal protein L37E
MGATRWASLGTFGRSAELADGSNGKGLNGTAMLRTHISESRCGAPAFGVGQMWATRRTHISESRCGAPAFGVGQMWATRQTHISESRCGAPAFGVGQMWATRQTHISESRCGAPAFGVGQMWATRLLNRTVPVDGVLRTGAMRSVLPCEKFTTTVGGFEGEACPPESR